MTGKVGQFKRINFFRGFLTTEGDWNDAEEYHVEKRRLRGTAFLGRGVVPHFRGGLQVVARGRDQLSVEIAPGYALDPSGHDIWVPEPEIKALNPKDYKLPAIVYLVIRFVEEPSDYISYKENPEFKGHRRMEEGYKIEFTNVTPDPERDVELGRIQLTRDVKGLTDARDPNNPGPNEVDMRFVPIAGVSGTHLSPELLWETRLILQGTRATYTYLSYDLGIPRAQSVLHSVVTLEMMLRSTLVRFSNLLEMLEILLVLQQEVILDLDANFPQQASTREFLNFKNQIRYLEQLFSEQKSDPEFLGNVLAFQAKASEALEKLHEAKKPSRKQEGGGLSVAELWNTVKTRSEGFGATLTLEKKKFKRIDEIDVLEKASEKSHEFVVSDYDDMYRSRQTFKYPDTEEGTAVKDQGVAFEGGKCVFTVHKAKLKRDVVLMIRIDYTHGDWEANVKINGQKASPWKVEGRDRTFRWRNWPYIIPADLVEEDSLQVEIEYGKAARDINLFRVWAFQAS